MPAPRRLTVLDDASRATLASLIVLTPDLCAAVRAFRLAAERWGLPGRIYADRASIFDSHAFRAGLADLGAHRIWVKPRNPEANGKIEAFHREPGFGLPELFGLLEAVAGRPVPRSNAEAARIHQVYRQIGPLPRRATEAALRAIAHRLGQGRPLDVYLDELVHHITHHRGHS